MKSRKLLIASFIFVLVICVPIPIQLTIQAFKDARYDRALEQHGGQRFTRSQAMEQKDNRTVHLLPDSEFKPEQQAEENN